MKSFSQRLDQAIRESGMAKGELATALGLQASTVSRWLSGTVPRMETVAEIAKALGVDVKWLIGEDDAPATLREEPGVYRVKRGPGAAPLRQPDEPTIMERLAAMEREREETKAALAAIMKSLDDLTDLFTNRKPRN